ncbi:MAG: 4-hydroxy-tetrahydrodipicolinate synthase [Phycisphaerae bacterium]
MNTAMDIRGSMTALVTPFRHGGVDWDRLNSLVDFQIERGIDWIVPCGTTGESPTLSHDEHGQVVEAVIARNAGRRPIMAGSGSNYTAEAIIRTKHAEDAGADAVLVVAPYYNRPPAEGLYRHFAEIAQCTKLPIVLYNVPFRTGVDIPNDVVIRLYEDFENIVAIKHATGSVDGVTELVNSGINVISGDDGLTWPIMALGGVGLISVVGNLCPELVKSLVDAGLNADVIAAREFHNQVTELANTINAYGPNPIPIKTAMAIAGLVEEEFRLPLWPLSAEKREQLERDIRRLSVLSPILA